MLLWFSAAGLAGTGWLGWLIWQDYDWSGVGLADLVGRSSSPPKAPSEKDRKREVKNDALREEGLLGKTQTDWHTMHIADAHPAVHDANLSNSEPVTAELPADKVNPVEFHSAHAPTDSHVLDVAQSDAAHEDFVVVGDNEVNAGIYAVPAAFAPATVTNGSDEDFVVVGLPTDEQDTELPEINLSDYVDQWTPVVPKIAALITHELWPQLRSYLTSLPQFGDANLEQVVNAVAGENNMATAETGGGGEESATGFAFYASLFEKMDSEEPSVQAELATA